jgi:hypothetical protein
MAGTGSPAPPGEIYMAGIVVIAAAGIFVIGMVTGIIAVVSRGIHREQKRFQKERRFRQWHGIGAGSDAPAHFLAEQAPDRVTRAARRVNGLHVRRLPSSIHHGADLDVRVQPGAPASLGLAGRAGGRGQHVHRAIVGSDVEPPRGPPRARRRPRCWWHRTTPAPRLRRSARARGGPRIRRR